MERLKYYVVTYEDQWWINFQDKRYGPYGTQAEAIETARAWARKAAEQGSPSQVLVQGRDGKFRVEWTYGDDPYPPKG